MLKISEIKKLNKAAGKHYFSSATMRFFGTKTYPFVWSGEEQTLLFITSERSGFDVNSPRRFTVRRFFPKTASIIATCAGFCAYKSLEEAKNAAKLASSFELSDSN